MKEEKQEKFKTLILAGFEREELFQIVRLIKSAFPNDNSVVFGSATEYNLKWTLGHLLEELHKEHREMQKIEQDRAKEAEKKS